MTSERVSVVIPVYNGAAFLAGAIESALSQTIAPDQVVVVDDGSEDGSFEVACRFGRSVEAVRQEHGGIGAGRNRGLLLVRGTHVALLDADDEWEVTKLEKQLEALRATGADMAWCLAVNFEEMADGSRRTDSALRGHGPSCLLATREAFQRVGPFDENLRVGEFLDWLARARESGLNEVEVEEVLLRRRVHATNTGITQAEHRVDYTRALRAALQRRRAVDPDA